MTPISKKLNSEQRLIKGLALALYRIALHYKQRCLGPIFRLITAFFSTREYLFENKGKLNCPLAGGA